MQRVRHANRGRLLLRKPGDFVMEYKGTCKKYYNNEYTVLQDVYQSNSELSYCLEFIFQGQKYFIDATREFDFGVARLIKHARNQNVKLFRPMQVEPGKLPRIAMFAATNIAKGEELFWDYFSSYNPTKCLLNTGDASAKGMKWIYSRRTKLGEIKYQIPKRKSYERNGVCVICYKHPKKLSNHLINTYKVNSKEKRLQLIKEGRKLSLINIDTV